MNVLLTRRKNADEIFLHIQGEKTQVRQTFLKLYSLIVCHILQYCGEHTSDITGYLSRSTVPGLHRASGRDKGISFQRNCLAASSVSLTKG